MKRLIFFIMLIVGFCFTTSANPVDVPLTSKEDAVLKQATTIGDHQTKFKSETAYLTVWRDHQKTADPLRSPPFR